MLAKPVAVPVLALAALLGCSTSSGSDSAPAGGPTADLRISVWPEGKRNAARPVRWTLRCGPAGGSLPRRAQACRRLLATSGPFRPLRRDIACTQIYGGPQVAEVRGRFRGQAVSARFSRTDGCEIERWNRVRYLFTVNRSS